MYNRAYSFIMTVAMFVIVMFVLWTSDVVTFKTLRVDNEIVVLQDSLSYIEDNTESWI